MVDSFLKADLALQAGGYFVIRIWEFQPDAYGTTGGINYLVYNDNFSFILAFNHG
jgi:hypothetical protein